MSVTRAAQQVAMSSPAVANTTATAGRCMRHRYSLLLSSARSSSSLSSTGGSDILLYVRLLVTFLYTQLYIFIYVKEVDIRVAGSLNILIMEKNVWQNQKNSPNISSVLLEGNNGMDFR